MKAAPRGRKALCGAPAWLEGAPLWQRVPKRDDSGGLLSDFMMIAPAFKGRSPEQLEASLARIQAVLAHFEPWVVFADFNLDLNLLWVSYRPGPDMAVRIAASLQEVVPELRLVAQPPDLTK